jgi:hypothetical protein
MLYTVIIGNLAPNGVISNNTFSQQIYLGIQGLHNVKIKSFEYNSTPVPADVNTGVLVRIPELFTKSNPTNNGNFSLAFLHLTNNNTHPYELDLGIQNLTGYLNVFIQTQLGTTLTGLNLIMYLEITDASPTMKGSLSN